MAQSLVQRDYYTVRQVTELIGMSESFCYKLVQKLNKELENKGCITFPGRVPKRYLQESLYCGNEIDFENGGDENAI